MANHPRDAVIVATCRTPFGRLGGVLSSVRPDDLMALALKEIIAKTAISPGEFEEVFIGCANQAGEDNRNISRMAVLLAGFPESVPGVTVNRLCASGLEAVVQGARAIRTGDVNLVIAGGVESMSRAPWVLSKPEKAFSTKTPEIFDSALGWRFPNPAMRKRFPLESMGETAENLAVRFSISRQNQDAFAVRSHEKAIEAAEKGYFAKSLLPIQIKAKKGFQTVSADEGPRTDATLEKLSTLVPVFRENGSVTAGNSSSLNDGAAALALCAREFAQAHSLHPLATVLGACSAGVSPQYMGIGPVPATQKLLAKLGMTINDIDLVELNEAFAAQALSVISELNLDIETVNIFGGALALGHPLGASGARILTSLTDALAFSNKSIGLATLCVGVGQGLSLMIRRD